MDELERKEGEMELLDCTNKLLQEAKEMVQEISAERDTALKSLREESSKRRELETKLHSQQEEMVKFQKGVAKLLHTLATSVDTIQGKKPIDPSEDISGLASHVAFGIRTLSSDKSKYLEKTLELQEKVRQLEVRVAEKSEKNARINQLASDNSALQERVSFLIKQVERATQRYSTMEEKHREEIDRMVERLRETKGVIAVKLQEKEEHFLKLEQQRKKDSESQHLELVELQRHIRSLNAQVKEREIELALANKSLEKAEASATEYRTTSERLLLRIDALVADQSEKTKEIERLKGCLRTRANHDAILSSVRESIGRIRSGK